MKTITPTVAQLRVLASMRGHQWAMLPDRVATFALAAMDAADKAASLELSYEDFYELRPAASVANQIGHIYVQGVLIDSCPAIYEKLGMVTRYETIVAELNQVIGAGARVVVMHCNSPGGTVAGLAEAAEIIADSPVPIVAHCQGLACSAMYYLAAGCASIIATPSATVGNIGTILSWADCTEFWKSAGIEFKAITNEGADLKSTFHTEPDTAQLVFLQQEIDEMGAQFKAHVAAHREVDEEVWRAGWYHGTRAGMLGLIDGVGSAADAEEHAQSLIG